MKMLQDFIRFSNAHILLFYCYVFAEFSGKDIKNPNRKRECGYCGKLVSCSNFKRHLKTAHPEFDHDDPTTRADLNQTECIYFCFFFGYSFYSSSKKCIFLTWKPYFFLFRYSTYFVQEIWGGYFIFLDMKTVNLS